LYCLIYLRFFTLLAAALVLVGPNKCMCTDALRIELDC
jgi:hypothetical protein